MVFLARSPAGLVEALSVASAVGAAVWCGADAISEKEFEAHESARLTRFSYSLQDANPAVLADALATIEEHHPGERIWVEERA